MSLCVYCYGNGQGNVKMRDDMNLQANVLHQSIPKLYRKSWSFTQTFKHNKKTSVWFEPFCSHFFIEIREKTHHSTPLKCLYILLRSPLKHSLAHNRKCRMCFPPSLSLFLVLPRHNTANAALKAISETNPKHSTKINTQPTKPGEEQNQGRPTTIKTERSHPDIRAHRAC